MIVHSQDDNGLTDAHTHPFRILTEDVSEEERAGIAGHSRIPTGLRHGPDSRNGSAAVQYVILGDRAKVCDVYQQIRGSDEDQGNRIREFDRTNGIADF